MCASVCVCVHINVHAHAYIVCVCFHLSSGCGSISASQLLAEAVCAELVSVVTHQLPVLPCLLLLYYGDTSFLNRRAKSSEREKGPSSNASTAH